ncbi:MAG: hypothetical protein IKD59_05485 [Lachnospiraceae bacterium]|nr:hypothetical protein [Lachnospiraceae bacterium]
MKAILVIDMPKNCAECKLMYLQGIGEGICNAVDWDERPTWCPLRPLPQKKEVEVNDIEDIMRTEYSIEDIYTNKYIATIQLATDKLISLGWNACLEEIQK